MLIGGPDFWSERATLCHNQRMPRRTSKDEEPDENVIAFQGLQELIKREDEREQKNPTRPVKNPAAVALGKLGGKKGGKARAAALSPEKRRQIALKAAKTRWAKKKKA